MNKLFLKISLICSVGTMIVLQACHDKKDVVAPPPVIPDQTFTQSFESLADAKTQGWIFKYQSNDPDFTYPWDVVANGNALDGTHTLYSYNDYLSNPNSDDVDSSISNWAISPPVWFQNGDSISFYTYSEGQTDPIPYLGDVVPDRLQLRMTRYDSTSNTGTTSTDVGSFVNPLIDINPLLEANGYPGTWKKYTAVIKGLNQPFQGRFAIRYYVPNFYYYGWGVHVDKVTYTTSQH